MRWIPVAILFAGIPAWFVYWINASHVLIFMYALFGYGALTAFAGCWADRDLPWQDQDDK